MKLQTVVEIEVPESFGSFQEAESKVREAVFGAGRELMGELMRLYEGSVLERKRFWRKDLREKRFQTLVGEVRMKRWRVLDVRERRHRYPLDEWLKVGEKEKATPSLSRAIVESCVQRPYRQATREIKQWTGVKRSPMANWKLIQEVGEGERGKEPPVPDWYLKPIPRLSPEMSSDPCPILGMDPDATYCHARRKEMTDHEVKVAVLYTGKRPEDRKKKRWRLQNKQILISRRDESVQDFHNRVSHKAMSYYGAHAKSQVVIHGDGDPWIKSLKVNYWDQALLRLDPWHVMKKIRLATGLREVPQDWKRMIYGDPDKLIFKLQGFKLQRTAPHSETRKKIEELIAYLRNNREGLLPSRIPQEIKNNHPGMFKRGSGTIESNIGHAFNARFKQPRMSWSPKGLDNLSYLREKYLNQYPKPRYRVPQPLTRKVA